MRKNNFDWEDSHNGSRLESFCRPFGGDLSIWRNVEQFYFTYASDDSDNYRHQSSIIYKTVTECKLAAVVWYKKKFRSGALNIVQHKPRINRLWAWINGKDDEVLDLDPIQPKQDMLERLLTHNYIHDHEPCPIMAELNKKGYNVYLNMVLEDRADMGWGRYEDEMLRALKQDVGVIGVLIRHMQTSPKSIPYNPGKSFVFSRSMGNSDAWAADYDKRQNAKEKQIDARFELLGLQR